MNDMCQSMTEGIFQSRLGKAKSWNRRLTEVAPLPQSLNWLNIELKVKPYLIYLLSLDETSLRSRRLEVVGERENERARETREG